jgi:hypothetical protein
MWFVQIMLEYGFMEHAAIVADAGTGQLNTTRECICICEMSPAS